MPARRIHLVIRYKEEPQNDPRTKPEELPFKVESGPFNGWRGRHKELDRLLNEVFVLSQAVEELSDRYYHNTCTNTCTDRSRQN